MWHFTHLMGLPLIFRERIFLSEDRRQMLFVLFENWLSNDQGTHPKVWSTLFYILEECGISTYALDIIKDKLKKCS